MTLEEVNVYLQPKGAMFVKWLRLIYVVQILVLRHCATAPLESTAYLLHTPFRVGRTPY